MPNAKARVLRIAMEECMYRSTRRVQLVSTSLRTSRQKGKTGGFLSCCFLERIRVLLVGLLVVRLVVVSLVAWRRMSMMETAKDVHAVVGVWDRKQKLTVGSL
jgi:hypothetical protein